MTAKGWEYDEYRLEMPLYDGLALDVAAAYDSYLAQARAEEESKNEFERMANSVAVFRRHSLTPTLWWSSRNIASPCWNWVSPIRTTPIKLITPDKEEKHYV